MSHEDKTILRPFISVLLALVVIAFVFYFIANLLGQINIYFVDNHGCAVAGQLEGDRFSDTLPSARYQCNTAT